MLIQKIAEEEKNKTRDLANTRQYAWDWVMDNVIMFSATELFQINWIASLYENAANIYHLSLGKKAGSDVKLLSK